MTKISIIAAISRKDRGLGKDNDLLWRIPDDLKRFKKLTMGHPIIMGRKTYESIGHPLPGRDNIVVTRNEDYQVEGVIVTHSLEEAIEKAKSLDDEEVFIIGGGQIYEQAIPIAQKLYLTLIDTEKEADVFFPEYENVFTKKIFEEKRILHQIDDGTNISKYALCELV